MRTLVLFLWVSLGLTAIRADPDAAPPPPAGIIILKDVAGYKAAAAQFVSIQWVNTYGGFVVDDAGNKLPFINDGIGRILYFDPTFYAEVDHNRSWIDWRAGLQDREVVIPPIHPIDLDPEDVPRLQSEAQMLQNTVQMYPAGKPIVDPLIASIQDACNKLSNKLLLRNGKWMSSTDIAAASEVPTVGDSEHLITFKTKSGKLYANAKVSVTETGLSVITSDGGGAVPFDQLPADLSVFPENIRKGIQTGQADAADADSTTAAAAPAAGSSGPGFFSEIGAFVSGMVRKVEQLFSSSSSSSPAPAPSASASPPAPAQPTGDPPAGLIDGELVRANRTISRAPGPGVEYYALYYSAEWCPPCHAFSPRLVDWYNKFKPLHPNFEVIFISEDHDESSMFDYMSEMSMPWPAVLYSGLRHDGHGTFKGSGIEQYAGPAIPDLVLVDASGHVLSDSFHGETYLGPSAVVGDINKIVGGSSPVSLGETRPSRANAKAALITQN